MNDLSLIQLYNHPSVNQLSGFANVTENLDVLDLAEKYRDLVQQAPRRHEVGKQYFVGHERFEPREGSNRKEEQLAGALFNHCRAGNSFTLPDSRGLKIIDYQFPLKAKRNDKDIGKVDLFGVVNQTIPAVIELKVHQDRGSQPDTPLRALLEGLAYCATVEANQEAISKEASSKFGLNFQPEKLHLIVLAPEQYWKYFLDHKATGPWRDVIGTLATQISETLGLTISFLSIRTPPMETAISEYMKTSIKLHHPF